VLTAEEEAYLVSNFGREEAYKRLKNARATLFAMERDGNTHSSKYRSEFELAKAYCIEATARRKPRQHRPEALMVGPMYDRRRAFAVDLSRRFENNYIFSRGRDALTRISGAIETTHSIGGSEEYWEGVGLGISSQNPFAEAMYAQCTQKLVQT
jgi:hypothetical protein